MKNFSILLAAFIGGISLSQGQEIPIQQETLGPSHYLLPLECYEGGAPKYSRNLFAPTVVAFADGDRTAVILPGSTKVAEFVDGKFKDLPLPSLYDPLSLAVDRHGQLYCLLQKELPESNTDAGAMAEFYASWHDDVASWSQPCAIPVLPSDSPSCDRIEFDAENRLWALGPSRKVSVWHNKSWNSYIYSGDKNLGFVSLRLADGAGGDVILFSNWQGERATSQMIGTLLYHEGQFIRRAEADTSLLRTSQKKKDTELGADTFGRSTGYVCRSTGALNVGYRGGAKTVLQTPADIFVSLGNSGLVWARTAELKSAPVFSEGDEWETISDVTMAPATDPAGTLWLARDNPPRLVRIALDKTEEIPTNLLSGQHDFTLFDQLGRPWFVQAHNVILFDHGFHVYSDMIEAMRAHGKDYKPGSVFSPMRETDRFSEGPGVLKTTQGQICLGGESMFDKFIIIGGTQTLQFAPNEIMPEQTNDVPGHGYNPFRHGEPREDKNDDILTCVDNIVFRYQDGKWIRGEPYIEPASAFVKTEKVPGDPIATMTTFIDGKAIIFRGFHFYEKTDHGLVQVDSGINPLAFYPFWQGWYESPGMTQPRLDPTGKIWVSGLGPYTLNLPGNQEDRVWSILRKPIP